MRLRNDPKAYDIVNNNELFIKFDCNDEDLSYDWNNIFNNNNPIYLEIGSGKGDFIINNAILNPDINYIGVEKNLVICSKIFRKLMKTNKNITNLHIINCDAKDLLRIFKDNSISKIFLNFSDPWPKKRHHKYRLTHPNFLNIYKKILCDNGVVEFKSDNDNFYNWSLIEINNFGCHIIYNTNDLYSNIDNSFNLNNVQTEYEKKFIDQNKTINKIIFSF